MTALTSWVLNHRRLVVGVWIAVTVGAFAAIGPAGDSLMLLCQVERGCGSLEVGAQERV